MLAYFLAITIALVSVNLYLTAFIRPRIHRRDDFLWSALGLFYGLTLWVCAGRITGAVLLGQLAIVSVAIAFIWENGKLRKAWREDETNTLEGFSVLSLILSILAKIPNLGKKKKPTKTTPQKVVAKTKAKDSTEDNQQSVEKDLSPVTLPETSEKVDKETPSSSTEEEVTEKDVTQEINQETEEEVLSSQDVSSATEGNGDVNLNEDKISDSTPDKAVIPPPQAKKGLFAKMKSAVGGIFKGKSQPVTPTTPITDDWMDSPETDDTSATDSNTQEVNEATTATSENNLIEEEDSLEQKNVDNDDSNELSDIEQLSDKNNLDEETEEEEKPADMTPESSTAENLEDEQEIVNQESEVKETIETQESNPETPPAEDTIESLTQLSGAEVAENINDETSDNLSFPDKEESEIVENTDNISEDWDKQEGKES